MKKKKKTSPIHPMQRTNGNDVGIEGDNKETQFENSKASGSRHYYSVEQQFYV